MNVFVDDYLYTIKSWQLGFSEQPRIGESGSFHCQVKTAMDQTNTKSGLQA
jgi:hypothetical protein